MQHLMITTTLNRKTNMRVPNIAEGVAQETIFNALRKFRTMSGGVTRVSNLPNGMHCDFEAYDHDSHRAYLHAANGDVLASATVDKFDV